MLCGADVWRQHHDELAGFMAAMAPDGAAQAINLTGLTLKGEMDMALRIGQYRFVATSSLCQTLIGRFLTLSALLLCTQKSAKYLQSTVVSAV